MSSAQEDPNATNVTTAPGLAWLGPFYKFGLPGITIAGMGFLIWTLIGFITGDQSKKVDDIKTGIHQIAKDTEEQKEIMKDLLDIEKTDSKSREDDHKELIQALREVTRAIYREGRGGGGGSGTGSGPPAKPGGGRSKPGDASDMGMRPDE